jgi:hypothetical protein
LRKAILLTLTLTLTYSHRRSTSLRPAFNNSQPLSITLSNSHALSSSVEPTRCRGTFTTQITSRLYAINAQVQVLNHCRVGTKMVTIRVGRPGETHDFAVYEKLIRNSSAFMDAALKEPWKESASRVVCLPDFRNETFDIYHLWLLSGKLHSRKQRQNDSNTKVSLPSISDLYDEIFTLRSLSHLGHYLLDTDFTDTVCDALFHVCRDSQSTGMVFPISFAQGFYKVIPQGSPIRSLVADVIAWTTTYSTIGSVKRHYPDYVHPDFLMDLLHAMSKRFLSPGTSTSPLRKPKLSCKYHSHGDEKECYRKKRDRVCYTLIGPAYSLT